VIEKAYGKNAMFSFLKKCISKKAFSKAQRKNTKDGDEDGQGI
jgi:hypothetical protein